MGLKLSAGRMLSQLALFGLAGLSLAGCSALTPPSMLDTAPKTDMEVRHPDWGEDESAAVTTPQRAQPSPLNAKQVMPMDDMRALLMYMENQQLRYDVIPGAHTVVKLEETVLFQTGSAEISPLSKIWLTELGRFLATRPNIKTIIDGHTDSTGSNRVNDPLSDKRALQVKLLLTGAQVNPQNVYTRGYGKHLPSCTNLSRQGKACNRRVEIMFIQSVASKL